MKTESRRFHSDGFELDGKLFLPEEVPSGERLPLVLPCSGFTGLCDIHPERFARSLTRRGLACFGFDFRGFAKSGGPRNRVILEEQVRDIRHAAAFAAQDPRVDPDKVFLLGWGMAGGLVLDAARELSGIAGLIAVNGFYDGARFQEHHRGPDGLAEFRREAASETGALVRTGIARESEPFHIYPWVKDSVTTGYVDDVLRKNPAYGKGGFSIELADSLLRWRPEAYAPGLRIPLLIAHGRENRLHPPSEAEALFAAYGGEKQLFWLEGAGHTEFMRDEDPKYQQLAARIGDWIETRLRDSGG